MLAKFIKTVRLDNLVSAENLKTDAEIKAILNSTNNFIGDPLDLLTYKIPQLSADGTCSLVDQLAEEPYDLRPTLGQDQKVLNLLSKFYQVIDYLVNKHNIDWIGIYKNHKASPHDSLVKLAYKGTTSRAEFPLTEEFAHNSNNSTVGLTGQAIVVQDVSKYVGPYYECDNSVLSEFCCPIIDDEGNILGIIDAESFKKDFFTNEVLIDIVYLSYLLREII